MDKRIVKLDLDTSNKIQLYGQITSRMEAKGFGACDFEALDLGFEVPGGWPVDRNTEPTLAQLVVLATKLGMTISIERLCMSPMPGVVDEDGQAKKNVTETTH